jgi:hypothetical protein
VEVLRKTELTGTGELVLDRYPVEREVQGELGPASTDRTTRVLYS